MKILLATNQLWSHTGSELSLLGLAQALAGRGHEVACHGLFIGPNMLEKLASLRLRLIEDPSELAGFAPDAIYCQHYPAAAAVRSRLPHTPLLLAHLGVEPELEQAPLVDCQVSKHLAISEEVRDALIRQAIPSDRITIFRNAIDTALFKSAGRPAEKALLFSYKLPEEWKTLLAVTVTRFGLRLDKESLVHAGKIDPADIATNLRSCRLVFASGRSALEAMISEAAVVILGPKGLDGAVTEEHISMLAESNFSGRRHRGTVSEDSLHQAVAAALSADTAAIAKRVRALFGLHERVQELERLLEVAISEPRAGNSGSQALVERFDRLLEEQRKMAVWQSRLMTKNEGAKTLQATKSFLQKAGLTAPDFELPEVRPLLSQATEAWRAGDTDAALAKYLTAFVFDRNSSETAQKFISFALVHLSTLYSKEGKVEWRKNALRAYLRFHPDNSWAVGALLKQMSVSADPRVFSELQELAQDWNTITKAIVAEQLASLKLAETCEQARTLNLYLTTAASGQAAEPMRARLE